MAEDGTGRDASLLLDMLLAARAPSWLDGELDPVLPKADALIQKMQLDVRYKDVTFETLNREDFLGAVKDAFPKIDWEKAYEEFRAAGEKAG
jgi:hypothetical protein